MKRQQLLQDAHYELSAFWRMPESAVLREGETHVLVLIDQKDQRNHAVMRQLGAEPTMDPTISRWTTLVLPRRDFAPQVRQVIEQNRGRDHYPLLVLADNELAVTAIPDLLAVCSN